MKSWIQHPKNGPYPNHQTLADVERREYDRLRDRLTKVEDAEEYLRDVRAITRFLNNEPNPVYGDALVTLVLSTGHRVVRDLLDEVPTYAHMMTKRVTESALTTESLWQGIMDDNASHQDR